MYRKKDDLEQLVQSLTTTEKTYLTKTFRQSSEDSAYLALYNALKMPKSRTSDTNLKFTNKGLRDQKHLLYKRILKYLKQMYPKFSIDVEIQNQLADVEILYNHSLADQAMRLLLKAKLTADKHEKFSLTQQILQWEQKLSIVLESPFRSIDEIRIEEEEVLAKTIQINLLLTFYSQIMLIKKEHGYAKGPVKETLDRLIIHNPSFPSIDDCKSNKAAYYHNLILSIYNWMTFDHIQAYQYSKALLKGDILNILPSDYLTGIFEHITSAVCIINFSDSLMAIQMAQAYMEEYKLNQSNRYRQLFFAYESTYRLIIYSYMGKQSQLAEVIHHAESWLEIHADAIPIERKQVVIGNIMNAYVAIGDLDKAWVVWNQLFNKQSESVRKDIYADLYLFRILFYLQTQMFDLITSAAASALRFFRKNEENRSKFQLEYQLVQVFAKVIDYSKPMNLNPLLHRARSILKDYIAEVSGIIGFQEHYTRYIIWLDAIEKKIPYYKAARDWYKQHSNLQD
ncbi:hypothetical protein [Sphingobacterium siyangense]|uniref:hypothetical protein n=1 Tax=Sphingobacterium siyangense TaxID=459529 RepID=UPI003018DE39